MQLTDDQYVLQHGGFLRIRSRSKAAEDMGRGRAKKDREDPNWRKRCHVSAEWSQEDRLEQSAKMKALWASDEYAERREAARQRLNAARGKEITDATRDKHRNRMLMGGAKKAQASRKIMSDEMIADRESRNAQIVRSYYHGKLKANEIARIYELEISWVYRILRTVDLE